MFKLIGIYFDFIFGPQPYEKNLRNTENPKIQKLLKITNSIRFLVFPLTFLFWLIGFILESLIVILDLLSQLTHFFFEVINDSMWLKLSWFNLTEEELSEEMKKLGNEKI